MLRISDKKAMDMAEEIIRNDTDMIADSLNAILAVMTDEQKAECSSHFKSICQRLNDIDMKAYNMKTL